MASKKFSILSAFLLLLVTGALAQGNGNSGSYDLRDSSLIPAKRMPQHNEWLNNAYPFPAKPRDQWEIGIKGGIAAVSADVRAWGPTGGFGVHVRRSLGYVFSVRAEYNWLDAKGLNWSPSRGYKLNPAWNSHYDPTTTQIFYNYKTTIQEGSIQAVITLNNLRFHKNKTGWQAYGFFGFGGSDYNTYINALNGTTPYDFSSIIAKYGPTGYQFSDRKSIKSDIKSLLDGSFETKAQADNQHPKFRPALVIGAGFAVKLNNKFNIAIEDKFTINKSDLIDGQQYQENDPAAPALTRDYDTYNFLSVGLNMNIGNHAVEPLYWLNPLDYAYSEINAPKHMKLPKPILDDTDGDGVTDQFDHEPNTPAGCPVDTHGVSRDTDGDGVPDCKDKELITPTQCQPVDADGVGKCPEPACCKELRARLDSGDFGNKKCNIGDLPSITFKGKSVSLSKDAQTLLASTAEKMRNNPNCKVAVVGYGESSKAAQQLSWDRVNEVIKYLVEKEGVSADRFIFRYAQSGGEDNTIDLKDGTGEEGPNTVPAPHPNLRKKK